MNISHYTIFETWEVQTLSLDPSTHSDGMQSICQLLTTAANEVMAGVGQTIEAFSHITGVSITLVTASQNCPDGSRIFFPNHGHRLAHPPVVAMPKAINHLKMDMVESFPLQGGGAYKNKGDGEREMEKIVFHSVTEVSKPDFAHIQNHGNDSYLLVPKFNEAEVRQLAANHIILPIQTVKCSLLSVTYCLSYFTVIFI